jgi:phosphate transport system substrate-binding protein
MTSSMKGLMVAMALGLILSLSLTSLAPAAVTLNAAGATFPQPLYNKWFYDFYNQTGVRVNYQGIGSGGGIKAIQSGTVAFAGSDAPLSDNDLSTMPAKVLQIPTCGGAVALTYNLSIGRQLRLTAGTLAGIFLGQITRWNDPRLAADNPGAGLPNKAITVVHRSDGSGTTYLFTNYLAAVSGTWRQSVGAAKDVKWPCGEGGKGNPGVVGLIKNIPGSIGYCELEYAAQNRLPVAQVKNRGGRFISPSLASATACIKGALRQLKQDVRTPIVNASGADAYPITGLTFLLLYQQQGNAADGAALVRLLKWIMTGPAQKTAAAYQYAPLPAELIGICKSKIGMVSVPR